MSTQRHDPHAGDYAAIAREMRARAEAAEQNTPRLLALTEDLAARERELTDEGRVIQAGELYILVEQLRLCLGHAHYEVSKETAAHVRARWNVVGPSSDSLSEQA